MTTAFDTPIETAEGWLAGPLRAPAQMLAEQSYDGHKSIHDDSMADTLGFKGGPIEGPTHFSQFDPLAVEAFGMEWFRTGCISCHFRAMVVEGEKTRAFLKKLSDDFAEIRMEKEDRTEVLKGTASLAGAGRRSALRDRVETVSPPQPKIILRDVEVGMTIPRTSASMEMDQHMGDLYPFSLKEKLAKITEPSPLYTDGGDFGGPVIPMEMLSVLAHYHPRGFPVRGPVVGLFADLEVALHQGPLLAGEAFEIEREVIALSGSRKTESAWIETRIYRAGADEPAATVLLNSASLKHSFEGYEEEAAAAS